MKLPDWMPLLQWPDITALVLFAIAWVAYEPLLKSISRRRGAINTDMQVVRGAWMREMARRDSRFLDGQLMGHTLNSASFFASANLIVIAAAMGVLLGNESVYKSVESLPIADAPRGLLEAKLALIVLTLGRGLLDFIWSIRQMNYCLALFGAGPSHESDPKLLDHFAEAATEVLNPALSSMSRGVRAYYFALVAAAWLFGAPAFIVALFAAVGLLIWRQSSSRSSEGMHRVRLLLEKARSNEP